MKDEPTMGGLLVKRNEGETWRQATERYADGFGLRNKVLESFDMLVEAGEDEDQAAWGACLEAGVFDHGPR